MLKIKNEKSLVMILHRRNNVYFLFLNEFDVHEENKQEKLIIISDFFTVNALWGKREAVGKPYELSVETSIFSKKKKSTKHFSFDFCYTSLILLQSLHTLNILMESNIFWFKNERLTSTLYRVTCFRLYKYGLRCVFNIYTHTLTSS